jgi:hypothetical protein
MMSSVGEVVILAENAGVRYESNSYPSRVEQTLGNMASSILPGLLS